VDTSTVSFVSPRALAARMHRPDAPWLIDVRRGPAFTQSSHMLSGALRCPAENIAAFCAAHEAREVVVYCVYGHQVSHEAAAAFQAAGWRAHVLAGGFTGGEDAQDAPADIAQWRAHRPALMQKRLDWGVGGELASRWITRERPKIDRVACPWLIRRFIDPQAQFFYVPTSEVFVEAERRDAIPYDIPGAPVSHVGAFCSFDTLLEKFDLQHTGLKTLAAIVRGADTGELALTAQSAGLLALSLGLSHIHAADDHAMLEAAMPLYDALYAWCCNAQDESHQWNGPSRVAPSDGVKA
jgi:rhodanese-related sulfurtransferase